MYEFKDKVVLVTGSSGIGLAAARHFAREGANVYVAGNDPKANETARQEARDAAIDVAEVDVANPDNVQTWIEKIGQQHQGIDALVNAAAIQTYGDTMTTDIAHWNKVIAINLSGCFYTAHFAYPFMKARGGGAIVHVASVQGHANQKNVLAYATSKGGIHALVRAQAVDAAQDNIRVNSISPGSIRTPMLELAARTVAEDPAQLEATIADFGKVHPIGRVGTVAETSALIAFLCSDKAGFCSGGDYLIDGALLASLGI